MAEYNGWTNYETWNVNLWLSNDQGSYNYWMERAREILAESEADGSVKREKVAALDLADELQSFHEEHMPETPPSVYADLLMGALSEVNWFEVAEHWIEDAQDQ